MQFFLLKKILLCSIGVVALLIIPLFPKLVKAAGEESVDDYARAQVIFVAEKQSSMAEDNMSQPSQKVRLRILSGDEKDKQIELNYSDSSALLGVSKLTTGMNVIVQKSKNSVSHQEIYEIIDFYRGTGLKIAVALFFVLVIIFARKRGVMAIVGMLFSVFVLFYIVVPHILKGGNAFVISILGGVLIIVFSIYLSHGFSKRTSLALVATLITLFCAIIFDVLFVFLAKLTGAGSEEAFYLQAGSGVFNLKHILLGSIIIGVLGVLDDVTTTQVATIEEIARANPRLTSRQLYTSGSSVGREHIASLVNTLVLAYAGAAFPLILFYSVSKNFPLWMLINSNFIAEEIIRTLVGSASLVLAVPIATGIAAYVYGLRTRSAPSLNKQSF
jgi:uncharacterized membrane protein